jgi:tryptophanyl-tRNA synthetase
MARGVAELPKRKRVLSGMRPTGRLHLGHYFGALQNWVELQDEYECFYFIADWHALTTHYEDTSSVAENTLQVVIDWLSVGLDPEDRRCSFNPASSSTPSCTCCFR